jgi:hypothetical protein
MTGMLIGKLVLLSKCKVELLDWCVFGIADLTVITRSFSKLAIRGEPQ